MVFKARKNTPEYPIFIATYNIILGKFTFSFIRILLLTGNRKLLKVHLKKRVKIKYFHLLHSCSRDFLFESVIKSIAEHSFIKWPHFSDFQWRA